ncbi:MAG: hypothetical protein IH872_10025 [Chloroflexi bacterium]|nr:hypothetical protein [Chloroflexota bacterium]
MADGPRGYEYKHVECPQDSSIVNTVTNDHAKFYWELSGTQTVVSKESHLEEGTFNSDNLYSVTTTERFVALDFQRATDIPQLENIKRVERSYYEICTSLKNIGASPRDNYGRPAPEGINFLIVIFLSFWIVPGVVYFLWKKKQLEKTNVESAEHWRQLKSSLDQLLVENKGLLNITG